MSATKNSTLKPLSNRVLAQRLEAEEKLAGGIILPDSAKKKQEKVRVIAAGPGKKDEPMPVKEGDLVLMDKYAGQEVTINDVEYVIARADDIIAIIEE